jgi:hypothetical protein
LGGKGNEMGLAREWDIRPIIPRGILNHPKDKTFSPGSPGALENERRVETALVTMERIILKREDLATRAGETEKGWGG